jgi:SAM-dependent methyltransferase
LLGRAAVRIGGAEAVGRPTAGNRESSWGSLPRYWQVTPAPRPIDDAWPSPPPIDDPIRIVRTIYETGVEPPTMDLALLEALNEEYRSRPLVPEPLEYEHDVVAERAQRRLLAVHRQIDLAGKRVLEFGCGAGYEVWYLGHAFGADAWGVDVAERNGWPALQGERTHLVCADITVDSPFDADSFDRIVSSTVLEHVVHPHAALAELYRILRPGGLASLSANLHRGPKASHLYRELHFPFPHLLFDDDVIAAYVIAAYRAGHGGEDAGGAVWVNRLTWAQYEDYLRAIGFRIRSLRFDETPLDEVFYERFGDVLGRYPRWDLERDFFHVVLEKPVARRS